MNKINSLITEDDILDLYLKEISKTVNISDKEEIELAEKIKEGDQKALNRLVEGNLKFVVSIAKQYKNQGLSLNDLISEGNIGLIKAAEKFDETKGFKFISYASYWIRQSILEALIRQQSVVRIPLNQVGSINKLNKASNKLEQDLERLPSSNELSKEVNISSEKIEEIQSISHIKELSIDTPLSNSDEDDNSTWVDVIENPNSVDSDKNLISDSLKNEIERCLSTLTEKEREILKLFFGINVEYNHTLEEIGEKFNLTRERVRQIKERAIRRLRLHSRSKLLIPYI